MIDPLLILFICLNAVLLSHEQAYIPGRDVIASELFAVTVGLAVIGVRISGGNKPVVKKQSHSSPQFASFQSHSNKLMQLEVIWTLLIPWVLLFVNKMYEFHYQKGGSNGDEAHDDLNVAYLVSPHLFFFQVQIILEIVLMVSHCDSIIFPYTAAANAYRALPLYTWIMRSLLTVPDMPLFSAAHWFTVVLLPCIATCLWLYSSFIFLPLEWYPVVANAQRTGM